MVMAARIAAAEHVRQEADAAGVDLSQLNRRNIVQRVDATMAAVIRQDLFNQPAAAVPADGDADDDRRAA